MVKIMICKNKTKEKNIIILSRKAKFADVHEVDQSYLS
jgi:hypothetical protein